MAFSIRCWVGGVRWGGFEGRVGLLCCMEQSYISWAKTGAALSGL